MSAKPRIDVVAAAELSRNLRDEIIALCDRSFDEPLARYFDDIGPGVHILAWVDDVPASHVMWVERKLESSRGERWRAAYVELVATDPRYRRLGLASRLMRELESHIDGFDIAALGPDETTLYERLGWEWWRGPLYVREAAGWTPSSASERIMIRRLPATPADIDLDAGLSIEWRPGKEIW